MTSLRLRFATTNAPESMKRGLLANRTERARRVMGFYAHRRIDVGAAQESGTYIEAVDNPARKTIAAKFNDLVKGRQVGNVVIVNRFRFKSRRLDDITVGTGDDAIHIAVVQVTHRRTGFTFTFRAVHKPTRRATNANLRAVVDAQLREATRLDDKHDRPWVIAGDFNGSTNLGRDLGSDGPDHIRGSKHFEPLGQKVVDRPLLSDHHFLIADVAVEV